MTAAFYLLHFMAAAAGLSAEVINCDSFQPLSPDLLGYSTDLLNLNGSASNKIKIVSLYLTIFHFCLAKVARVLKV